MSFFPSDKLTDCMNIICRLRAEINMALMEAIAHREDSNALYFDRLCIKREKELKDPDDVLLDAEMRKKEKAEEERRMREEGTPLPEELM